jgi:hypothetical protein
MDPRAARLKTVEQCEILAENALKGGYHQLAKDCRERAVQLRAEKHGAKTEAEKECLEAIYALEAVRSEANGRTTKAARTWQAIKRHGIIPTVERVVARPQVSDGFKALEEMGLKRYAFEAVVLRHPDMFSPEAVEISRRRLGEGEL